MSAAYIIVDTLITNDEEIVGAGLAHQGAQQPHKDYRVQATSLPHHSWRSRAR